LVDGNVTMRPAGRSQGGYTDTFLPPWCQAVVVGLVRDTGVPDVPEVTGPAVSRHRGKPGSVAQPIPPRSADFSGSGRSVWLHPLPGAAPADGGMVRTAPPPGWRLGGVFGIARLDGDWRPWPPRQEPAPASGARPASAASRSGGAGSASRVWWQ